MQTPTRKIEIGKAGRSTAELLGTQWLVTNGLGGYASGTLAGIVTWRYHGLLIAALPAPFGRMLMLNHLAEFIRCGSGNLVQFGGDETSIDSERDYAGYLTEFRLENGLPVWRYDVNGSAIEKRILLIHRQNTVHVTYKLLSGDPVEIHLRPSMHFRPHEGNVSAPIEEPYEVHIHGRKVEVVAGESLPKLRMHLFAAQGSLTHDYGSQREIFYQHDADRGYESRGVLWSPGYFTLKLETGESATLAASTESWSSILALSPVEAAAAELERRKKLIETADPSAREGIPAELVLAADQFIITPAGREQDAARARAAGDEVRTVIAGYHWFTDWGRDTMISLEGLSITTGRYHEAGWILRTFAHYVKDGLIPNMFPEGQNDGLYHTADASLWFFHAVQRYLDATNDQATLAAILPKLREIISKHVSGTKFGIGVDPSDGLLRQGKEGYQLTWMDAKVGDWVVTPRRGKAVELNALWFNALNLMQRWLRDLGDQESSEMMAGYAARARESFNKKFWHAEGQYLFDVVEGESGNDPAFRPNQVFAIALDYPILDQQYWKAVIDQVKEKLLTPVGLRSLSCDHKDYQPRYFGNLRARDAAYHQGTVWGWLIGPFIDAWLKVYPDRVAEAEQALEGFDQHLNHGSVGSINEVFDADPPFTPRGCIAQAWSVAEVLRCWTKLAKLRH
ncbi:MAG: amylo-alpha-1,6-glucosidase [Verrucomicrobiales bacterium]